MDFPGLAAILTGFGPPGVIIGYLLWERRDLLVQLRSCQEARLQEIKSISAEMKAAFATSTEVLRANNLIQDKASASALQIAEALRLVQARMERQEDQMERIEKALP